VRWWDGSVTHNREMDVAERADDEAHPPLVGARSAAVVEALADGAIVAVPGVGGYSLAVRTGSSEGEARLVELAADPDGPHYAVGRIEDVRTLTSGWTDEMQTLLERCWPGPVEVFVPRAVSSNGSGPETEGNGTTASGGLQLQDNSDDGAPQRGAWAVVVGMPDGRALRQLCRDHGPWRTVPLRFTEAKEVAQAFRAEDVAVVVDGGSRQGLPPTVVDATVKPIRFMREGLLPASFIQGTMMMSARRKLFSSKKKRPGAG
jgi:tRNA A37 threonylcarbamoyladenosine synthetase subunit TsaC/SUA5/YrdC